jgi:hypothetical protein
MNEHIRINPLLLCPCGEPVHAFDFRTDLDTEIVHVCRRCHCTLIEIELGRKEEDAG